MPIEINELIVRARITDEQNNAGTHQESNTGNMQELEKVARIEQAVQEIKDVLKRKNER